MSHLSLCLARRQWLRRESASAGEQSKGLAASIDGTSPFGQGWRTPEIANFNQICIYDAENVAAQEDAHNWQK